MEKTRELFDIWNKNKQYIEFTHHRKIVKPGEIWLCKIWVNIGSEISKDDEFVRPILVLKTGIGWDLISMVPITTKYNHNFSYAYYTIGNFIDYGLAFRIFCVLNQARVISIKRLTRKLNNIKVNGKDIPLLPYNQLSVIKQKINKIIFQ